MKYAFVSLLLAANLTAQPAVVDGSALETALTEGIIEFSKDGEGPSADALIASLAKAPKTLALPIPEAAKTDTPEASIYILATVYDCGNCDQWHLSETASAWALSEDGMMVSSYDVFKKAKGAAMGVSDKDGNVHRVTEILAVDSPNDIVIFRVNAKGLKPLPLGPPAAIGDEVKVISHPAGLFFKHTFSRVSRYHTRENETRMSITAEFTIGSSGAPVLDAENRVVGMVAATRYIYANEEEKGLQMMFKECVPVSAIAANLSAQPVAVDDAALSTALAEAIIEFTKGGSGPTADALSDSLTHAPKGLALTIPEAVKTETPEASIYILSTVYDCGNCDEWHLGGTASAWALAEDGLMVSNYHVFQDAKGAAMGVCDKDGNVHRVTEILAVDPLNDIAIFRVNTKGLKPLPLGPPAAIGDQVKIISHPDELFFCHTFGRVSRYHKRGNETQMSITADFAIGSSGAPILDAENRVVGMVVSTRFLYSDGGEKGLQMVVKNTVPASTIAAMLAGAGKSD